MTIFVCPNPRVWAEIVSRLTRAWTASGRSCPPPPRPLILAGWQFSNDFEKQARWEQTVTWANDNGLAHLIPKLTEDMQYRVLALSDGTAFNYLAHRNHEPRDTPDDDKIVAALQLLKNKWSSVAGLELAAVTAPIRFTGRKMRRLVVAAVETAQPPWGSWSNMSPLADKQSFSRFRAAINAAISPHAVDHVDFRTFPPDKFQSLHR